MTDGLIVKCSHVVMQRHIMRLGVPCVFAYIDNKKDAPPVPVRISPVGTLLEYLAGQEHAHLALLKPVRPGGKHEGWRVTLSNGFGTTAPTAQECLIDAFMFIHGYVWGPEGWTQMRGDG